MKLSSHLETQEKALYAEGMSSVSEAPDTALTDLDHLQAMGQSGNGSGNGGHRPFSSPLSSVGLLELLWSKREFILYRVISLVLISGLIAFFLPNHYMATTRLMPPGYGASSAMALALPALSDHSGAGGGGAGVMGLASELLGMNTSGELFVGVIQSQTVEDRVISKFGLMKVYSDKYLQDARKDLEANTYIATGSKTGIISISVTDKQQARAAQLANAYVTELNKLLAEVNTSSAHRERAFLEERLQEIKQQSDADAKEFAEFASHNAALDIPEQAKAMVTAGAELQSQMIVAQSELQGLLQIYTPENARVKSAKARLDELQRQAEKFGGKDVDPAKDSSLAHSELYPSVRQLPLLGVKYLDLYRRTKVNEAVFELLTKEYEIAKIQEAKEIPAAQVLDPATLPEKKSSPHRLLIILWGALAGFVMASSYLIGQVVWKHTDDTDPRKRLAQDVISTAAAWTDRTPFRRRVKTGFQRLSVWRPRPSNGRSG